MSLICSVWNSIWKSFSCFLEFLVFSEYLYGWQGVVYAKEPIDLIGLFNSLPTRNVSEGYRGLEMRESDGNTNANNQFSIALLYVPIEAPLVILRFKMLLKPTIVDKAYAKW